MVNRLASESSPYLLQHAENPVDWYPWGEDAFREARQKDLPVFLSIGYSTCHWCHVMAHESFENDEVATLLNRGFIAVKVDREEHPDIDHFYMTVAQVMTGSGGWPLTIIMTPEKEPFFAATYIPRQARFGSPGLLDLLPAISGFWKNHRNDIQSGTRQLLDTIMKGENRPSMTLPDRTYLEAGYHDLAQRFDPLYGGFGQAPKFPSGHIVSFLLRYWRRSGSEDALRMAEYTLYAMYSGGIYDHLGSGFHRYSTDREWHLPHFEKMLYDQALCITAYTEAFLVTGKVLYRNVAEDCISYLLHDMHRTGGGFYSAEDADSAGMEGAYYAWTTDEVRALLGNDAPPFIRAYNMEEGGNYQSHGSGPVRGNVLYPGIPEPGTLPDLDLILQQESALSPARARLQKEREGRQRPGLDDKILTDWNGLVISALSSAARAFKNPVYRERAIDTANFLLETMCRADGELFHRFRGGNAGIRGVGSDYAFLCRGLLDLYEATLDERFLDSACRIEEYFSSHFWDPDQGGYFFTHSDERAGLFFQKEVYDGALPSINSVALKNLWQLGLFTGNMDYHERAWKLATLFAGITGRAPSGFCGFLASLDFVLGPSSHVVIRGGRSDPRVISLVQAIDSRFLPSVTVMVRGEDQEIPGIHPGRDPVWAGTGAPARAYICTGSACARVEEDPGSLITALEKSAGWERT